jgi:hypothetical protein
LLLLLLLVVVVVVVVVEVVTLWLLSPWNGERKKGEMPLLADQLPSHFLFQVVYDCRRSPTWRLRN